MRRLIVPLLIAALGGTAARAIAAQTAPPPVSLPQPPAPGGQTNTLLIGALLAIERAQVTNPAAANAAQFPYTQAISRYHLHDLAGARADAIQALSVANEPAAAPATAPAAVTTIAGPKLPTATFAGTDTGMMDAEAFFGLARDALGTCRATGDALTGAQRSFAAAQTALAANNAQATRVNAKATIDACAGPP